VIGIFAASFCVAIVDDADAVGCKLPIARPIFFCIGMRYFENTPFALVEDQEIGFLVLSACGCCQSGFGVGEEKDGSAIALCELGERSRVNSTESEQTLLFLLTFDLHRSRAYWQGSNFQVWSSYIFPVVDFSGKDIPRLS